jgi:hypothetical protein
MFSTGDTVRIIEQPYAEYPPSGTLGRVTAVIEPSTIYRSGYVEVTVANSPEDAEAGVFEGDELIYLPNEIERTP